MLNVKLVSKFKATKLAFATQKITFNREKMSNILDTFNIIEIKIAIAKKPKTPHKKNKKQKN